VRFGWLGLRRQKKAVEKIINIGEKEDFVALIPVGYSDK